MKVFKSLVTTALIMVMVLSPFVAKAEEGAQEVLEVQEPEYLLGDFIGVYGTIKDINEVDGRFSILVESHKEEPNDQTIFYVTEETLLVSNKSMDIVNKDYLKEGMEVMAYYPSDIILPMIYPLRIPAEVIAVMEDEEFTSVEVYNFDEDLISKDRILQIYPTEETTIVDREGHILEIEDIKNSKAVVFYKIAATSLPAKAAPEKVIILEQALKEMNKVIIEGNEIILKKPMFMKEDILMVPVRDIAEALGYKVKWDGKDYSVELIKDEEVYLLKIGQNTYNIKDMEGYLDTVPELTDSTTYVPATFLEFMGLKLRVVYDGVLSLSA